jgi:hypothetical protein
MAMVAIVSAGMASGKLVISGMKMELPLVQLLYTSHFVSNQQVDNMQ